MSSIAAWLDQLGLSQYAPAFEANAIDMALAANLSDADLRQLGVAALGHRKRLLDAIDALRRHASTAPGPGRRHLTVLFCDIVESTALSARLEPEDMAFLIGSYQRCGAAAIAGYEGFVAQFLGDGILAYFGYPQAQEDSAERAVRAALALVRDVGKLEVGRGITLRVRVGIATGAVVVGDITGGGAFERNAAVGETLHLAARLETVAGPDQVVIAGATQRLVAGLFDCVALDPLTLKGFAAPIRAWRVEGDRAVANRFEARRAEGLAPHLGREAELDALSAHWRSVEDGTGHFVMIAGEPGIGKSRLVSEFADRIPADARLQIKWSGSPYLQSSPLGPVIAQLERAAGFVSHDPPESRRAKLDALLAAAPHPTDEAAAIMASLLSLPIAPPDPPPDPDPMRQRSQTLNTVVDLLADYATLKPVLLACEDVHWFDPTTLELLSILVERLAGMRILVIATFRREFVPSWGERTWVSTLELERIERGLATAMVRQLAQGNTVLSPELVHRIVERADGVPLFIEELTKTVLESSPAGASGGLDASIAIPDTLQDSLVARLERLVPTKEIAQIGAAIGREFAQSLLEAVISVDAAAMRATLDRLIHSNLLQRRVLPSGVVYVFKHALVQDAAYGTLLHAQRRAIHRRIAEALETRFSETVEHHPERLADHWERADAPEPAIRYLNLAGQRAAGRSAAVEAQNHYSRALRLVERLQPGDERDRLELKMSAQQGGVLRATRGPPAIETGKAFARARELCRRTGDNTLLVPALAGLFGYHFVRAENRAAGEVARELLAFGESAQDRQYRMIGHRAVGMVLVHIGKPAAGCEHLEQSLNLYDTANDGALAFVYGTDHAQTASSLLALAHWLLGLPDSAAAREAWAVAHGSKVNHLYSLAQTAMFRIIVRALARDWDAVAALAQANLEVGLQHSFQLPITLSRFYLAATQVARGVHQGAIEEMRAAAEAWGPINYRPLYLGLIAEAQAAAGDSAGGLRGLAEARALVEATGERWIEPELCRLSGELRSMLEPPSLDAAEALFREAIAQARQQGAKSWELRSSVSLARLLKRRDRKADARTILAPVHDAFTQGMDTPDLKEARSLLSAL